VHLKALLYGIFLAKLRVHSFTLPNSEDSSINGNIVDWTDAEWELTNMKKDNVDFSKMCKALSLGPVIVPEKLPATKFKHLCNQFGGKMFVIKNEADRQTAMDFYDKGKWNSGKDHHE
jgi:hypothetical protein